MSETSLRTLNPRLQYMFDYVEQFCELGAECDIPLELLLCYPEVPFQFYFGTQTMDWKKYVLEFADLFEIYYLNKHSLMNLDFRQKDEINLLVTVTKSVKGGIDYKALQDYIIRKRSKFKIERLCMDMFYSARAGTKISRWPLLLMALTIPAFSISSTKRAARL